jgi:hypothetical protein
LPNQEPMLWFPKNCQKYRLTFAINLIITLLLKKNANLFAENCDLNIDP